MFNFIPLSYYTLSAVINFIATLAISVFVFSKNPRSETHRAFCFFTLSVSGWSLCYFLWLIAESASWADFCLRTLMLFVIFIPTTFTHFVLTLLKLDIKKKINWVNYPISALLGATVYTQIFAKDLTPYLIFPYWLKPGPLFHIHSIHFFANVIVSHILMIKTARQSEGIFRNQILSVFIGTAIGFGSGVLNYLTWYRIQEIPPFLNCLVPLYVAFVGYAIIRYRLMDIHFVIRKTVTNAILIALASLLMIAISLTVQSLLLKVILNIALATIFILYIPKTKIKTEATVTTLLYKDKYDYLEELRDFTHGTMVFILKEHELLNEVAGKIFELMKVKEVRIYLREGTSSEYVPRARVGGREEKAPRPIEGFGKCDDIFIPEEHIEKPKFDTDINIYVPIVLSGSDVLGYITLSSKTTGEMFTHLDLELLKRLGMQLAIVLNYKKMEKWFREHENTENLVRMVMELSHQFHNRLASVETLFRIMSDKNKNDPKAQEYQELADLAIEHMNAIFYKLRELAFFANMDSPRPKDTEIGAIIDRAIGLQSEKVKGTEIKIERKEEPHLPKIFVDEQLIIGAVSNVLENAVWAVMEETGKIEIEAKLLQEKTPEMTERCENWVRITMKDNGPGLSEEAIQKAFDAFYTTKSRGIEKHTAGFGLGLTLARRICEAHGGYIKIKSKPGETIVTIDLPIKYGPLINVEKQQKKEKPA